MRCELKHGWLVLPEQALERLGIGYSQGTRLLLGAAKINLGAGDFHAQRLGQLGLNGQ